MRGMSSSRSSSTRCAVLIASAATLAISCNSNRHNASNHDAGVDAGFRGVPRDQQPLSATPGTWTWIDVPESKCQDGTPTGFAINVQDTSDLFIFYEGGG